MLAGRHMIKFIWIGGHSILDELFKLMLKELIVNKLHCTQYIILYNAHCSKNVLQTMLYTLISVAKLFGMTIYQVLVYYKM